MPTILTILYTERVLAGTPPLHAGPQSRVDTRTVNSVNTVTGKYLVTHRKYLVLHCYFDGAPAFPDKSQFLTAPPHLAAGSTYSPHSSVTDNCRHGDFRRNIFFRLCETTCKRCKMMFDNVQFNILLAESCPHIKIITVVHKTFTNSWFGLTKIFKTVHLRYICKQWTRIEDSIFYFSRWDNLLKCPLPQ